MAKFTVGRISLERMQPNDLEIPFLYFPSSCHNHRGCGGISLWGKLNGLGMESVQRDGWWLRLKGCCHDRGWP